MQNDFYVDNSDKFSLLEKELKAQKEAHGSLIMVMQGAQDIFGYLPIEVQEFIAQQLNIPLPDIYGVATFYSQFILEKQGKHNVNVCQGTACYVKGSRKVQDEIEKELQIASGETTEDGLFTLNETRCVGACGLAPVVMIDEDSHGKLIPKDIKAIIDKYKLSEDQ